MTKDEINKALASWQDKRKTLPCPVIGAPCSEAGCRFYLPMVVGKQIGPNLPPIFNLEWMCQLEQMFNMLGELKNQGTPLPQAVAPVPGLALPKVFRPGAAN